MDSLQVILGVVGAIIGAVLHVIKKQIEIGGNGNGELAVVKAYLVKKPFSTLVAGVSGVGIALGLQLGMEITPLMAFLNALVAGFAGNSLFNRPGEVK